MQKITGSKLFLIALSMVLLVLAIVGFYVSISVAETTYWLSIGDGYSAEQQAIASDDASATGMVVVFGSFGLLVLVIKCFSVFLDLRKTKFSVGA